MIANKVGVTRRALHFGLMLLILTALMYAVWISSAYLLPEGVFRPYFTRLFNARVGEFTFIRVFLANFILPFLGVQFMNLFRVNGVPGGMYVLPIFWVIYGLLLGTNSFVFAGERVAISVSILWTRTGFTELLAYSVGYEASRHWALWEQRGMWRVKRIEGRKWRPSMTDLGYWIAGVLLLVLSAAREVQG